MARRLWPFEAQTWCADQTMPASYLPAPGEILFLQSRTALLTAETLAAVKRLPASACERLRGRKILVVDDFPMDLEMALEVPAGPINFIF